MPSPRDLLPQVYDELRRLVAARLASEKPGHSLDATALVHEAWLRLAEASVEWQDRNHFLRVAATAMRRILVDQARARRAAKRGGAVRVDGFEVALPAPEADLSALGAALDRLAAIKPDHAKLVELRYFTGLSGDEAPAAIDVSPATADLMWHYARAWLQVEIAGIEPG